MSPSRYRGWGEPGSRGRFIADVRFSILLLEFAVTHLSPRWKIPSPIFHPLETPRPLPLHPPSTFSRIVCIFSSADPHETIYFILFLRSPLVYRFAYAQTNPCSIFQRFQVRTKFFPYMSEILKTDLKFFIAFVLNPWHLH